MIRRSIFNSGRNRPGKIEQRGVRDSLLEARALEDPNSTELFYFRFAHSKLDSSSRGLLVQAYNWAERRSGIYKNHGPNTDSRRRSHHRLQHKIRNENGSKRHGSTGE